MSDDYPAGEFQIVLTYDNDTGEVGKMFIEVTEGTTYLYIRIPGGGDEICKTSITPKSWFKMQLHLHLIALDALMLLK